MSDRDRPAAKPTPALIWCERPRGCSQTVELDGDGALKSGVTTMDLTRIAQMIDARLLTVYVGTVLPFGDARIAHEMMEGLRPNPRGKIVLNVGPRSDNIAPK